MLLWCEYYGVSFFVEVLVIELICTKFWLHRIFMWWLWTTEVRNKIAVIKGYESNWGGGGSGFRGRCGGGEWRRELGRV